MSRQIAHAIVRQLPRLVSRLSDAMPEVGMVYLTIKGVNTEPDDKTTSVELLAEFAGLSDGEWSLEELTETTRETKWVTTTSVTEIDFNQE